MNKFIKLYISIFIIFFYIYNVFSQVTEAPKTGIDFNWQITGGFPAEVGQIREFEFTQKLTAKAPILPYTGTSYLREIPLAIDYDQYVDVKISQGGCGQKFDLYIDNGLIREGGQKYLTEGTHQLRAYVFRPWFLCWFGEEPWCSISVKYKKFCRTWIDEEISFTKEGGMFINWAETKYFEVNFYYWDFRGTYSDVMGWMLDSFTYDLPSSDRYFIGSSDFDNASYVKTSVLSMEKIYRTRWEGVRQISEIIGIKLWLKAQCANDVTDIEPTDSTITPPKLVEPENNGVVNRGAWYPERWLPDGEPYKKWLPFIWENNSNRTPSLYQVQIWGAWIPNPQINIITPHEHISVSDLVASLHPGDRTDYYWKVRMRDSYGKWSNWSDVYKVTIDVACARVSLSSPFSGTSIRDNSFGLFWNPVYEPSQPVTYNLWVYNLTTYERVMLNNVGSGTGYTVTLPSAKYRWAVQAIDAAGNTGPWSDIWNFYIDTTPPAAVTLKVKETTMDSVTLEWEAPGNDGNSGEIMGGWYCIKYSDVEKITSANWNVSTHHTIEWSPYRISPGYTETKTIDGLGDTTSKTYYFALKTADESIYWSDISNVVEVTMPANVVADAGNCKINEEFSHLYVTISEFSVYRDDKWIKINPETKTLNLPQLHEESRTENIGIGTVKSANYSKIRFGIDKVTGTKKATGETINLFLSTHTFEFPCEFTSTGADIQFLKIYFDLEKSIKFANNKYEFSPELLRIIKQKQPISKSELISDNLAPKTTLVPSGLLYSEDDKNYAPLHYTYTLTAEDPTVDGISSGVQVIEYSTATPDIWQIYSVPFTLTEGIRTVKYRAIDKVGNMGKPNSITICVDGTPPYSGISYPVDSGFYSNLPTISGTSSDDISGVRKVEISIKDIYDNKYWNGAEWVTDETWLPVNSTAQWTYTSPAWTVGKLYSVKSQATDRVGNTKVSEKTAVFYCIQEVVFDIVLGGADPLTFNPELGESTKIFYQLSENGYITVSIDGQIIENNAFRSRGLNTELWGGAGFSYGEHNCIIRGVSTVNPAQTDEVQFKIRLDRHIPVVKINYTAGETDVNKKSYIYYFLSTLGYKPRVNRRLSIWKPDSAEPIYDSFWSERPVGDSKYWYEYPKYPPEWFFSLENQPSGIYRCRIETNSTDKVYRGNAKTVVIKNYEYSDGWVTNLVTKRKLELAEYPRNALKEIYISTGPKHLVGAMHWAELDQKGILTIECPQGFYTENLRIFRYEPYFLGMEKFDFAAYGQEQPPPAHWVELEKQYVDPVGWQPYGGYRPTISAEIDYGGLFAVLSVADTTPPEITDIVCTPSPFSPDNDRAEDTTAISYTLSDDYSTHLPWTTIEIYNSQGALVRTLIKDVRRDFGKNEETWDGKDEHDKVVPVGTYTVKIKAVDLTGNSVEAIDTVEVRYTQIIDITPPSQPIVDDGGDYTNSTTELYALWFSCDSESAILENSYTIEGQQQVVVGNWEIAGYGYGIGDPLENHSTLEYNGWMYVIGGQNTPNKMYYTPIDSEGKVRSDWKTCNLPLSYYESSAVLWNGKIYLLGRGTNAVYVATIDPLTYGISAEGWKATTSLPTGIDGYRAVVSGGIIYVLPYLNTKIYYSKISEDGFLENWETTTADLPARRYSCTLTSYAKRIYLIGGFLFDPPYGDTGSVIFGETTDSGDIITWKATTSLPETRGKHSTIVNGSGVMYVTGGVSNAGYPANTVFYGIIDPVSGEISSWGYGTPLPYEIDGVTWWPYPYNHSSIIYDNWLYVIGGHNTKWSEYATIQRLRITVKEWTHTGPEQSVRVVNLNLKDGETYFWGIKSKNEYDRESETGYSYGIKVDITMPTEIKQVSVVNLKTGDKLKLSWVVPSGSVSGYNIYQSTNFAFGYKKINTLLVSETEFIVYGLMPEQEYYYRIAPVNPDGKEAIKSFPVKGIPTDIIAPSTITDLKLVSVDDRAVTLTWTSPGDNETEGNISGGTCWIRYTEKGSIDDLESWNISPYEIKWSTGTVSGKKQVRTVSGLNTNTLYYFAIRTEDEVGNWSGVSNSIPGMPIIDRVAPQTTFYVVSGAKYIQEEKLYTSTETIYGFLAEDFGVNGYFSGLTFTEYRINEGMWQTYVAPFSIAEGIHKIDYASYDKKGNRETTKSTYVYVDATPPVSEILVGEPKYEYGNKFYVAAKTKFEIISHDPVSSGISSGVSEIFYQIDPGIWIKYTGPFTPPEGAYKICYYAVDNVSNHEEIKFLEVIVDVTPPIFSGAVVKTETLQAEKFDNILTRTKINSEGTGVVISEPINLALNKSYTKSVEPNFDFGLTDGNSRTGAFFGHTVNITIDLGETREVDRAICYIYDWAEDYYGWIPERVEIFTSKDNQIFTYQGVGYVQNLLVTVDFNLVEARYVSFSVFKGYFGSYIGDLAIYSKFEYLRGEVETSWIKIPEWAEVRNFISVGSLDSGLLKNEFTTDSISWEDTNLLTQRSLSSENIKFRTTLIRNNISETGPTLDYIQYNLVGKISCEPQVAKYGDTVTISFASSEPLRENPQVGINGRVAEFQSKSDSGYTYTYYVPRGDKIGENTITITGTDIAGNIGIDTSAKFTIEAYDPTPPTRPIVADEGDYTSSLSSLSAWWSSKDPETGVIENKIAIGISYPYIGDFIKTTPLPWGWGRLGGTIVNDKIYISRYMGTPLLFAQVNPDGTLGSWATTTGAAAYGAVYADLGSWKDKIYAVDGGEDIFCGVIDINTGHITRWNRMPLPPVYYYARYNPPKIATYKDNLYLIGGYETDGNPDSVFCASIFPDGSLSEWKSLLALPEGRYNPGVIIWNNKVYVIGGKNPSWQPSATVYYGEMDSSGNIISWKMGKSLPGVKSYPICTVTDNGVIYVTGGEWTSKGLSEKEVLYGKINAKTGEIEKWQLSYLPVPRASHAAILHKNNLYIVGGYSFDVATTTVLFAPAGLAMEPNVVGWTSVGKNEEVTFDSLTLTEGQTYQFGVKTKNAFGVWSDIGYSDGITVNRAVPSRVENVMVTDPQIGNTLDIKWSAVENATGYNIYKSTDRIADYISVNLTPVRDTEFRVTNLVNNVTCYFQITAVNTLEREGPKSLPVFGVSTVIPDTVPPEKVFLSVAEITENSIELTWTAPGDDGTIGNIVNGQYWIKYSTYLVDGLITSYDIIRSTNTTPGRMERKNVTGLRKNTPYYFMIKIADESSNWSEWSNVVSVWTIIIDITPPVSYIEIFYPKFIENEMVFISSLSLISITAEDPVIDDFASGVAYTEYSIDEEPWTIYVTSFTLSEGVRTIRYRSADIKGNFEINKTTTLFVDGIHPLSEIEISSPVYVDPTTETIFVSSKTKFCLSAQDILSNQVISGIKEIKYQINSDTVTVYTADFYLIDEGSYTIKYYATDIVENIEPPNEITVYVDTTPPTTKLEVVGIRYFDGVNLFVSSNTKFNLYSEDTGSGLKYIEYKIDSGDWQVYSEPVGISSEGYHTLYYRGVDNVDNFEEVKIFEVVVDITPPVTDIILGEPRYDILVTPSTQIELNTVDGGVIPSGVMLTKYWVNAGEEQIYITPFTITGADGIYMINYKSIDNAHNQEIIKSTSVVLDNSPPQIVILNPLGKETFIATQDRIDIDFAITDLGPFSATGYLILIECVDNTKVGTKVQVTSGTSIEPLDLPYYGFYVLRVEAVDWAGQDSSSETAKFEVIWDIQPPRTTMSISDPKYYSQDTIYVSSETLFTLTAVDDLVEPGDGKGLGVKETKYRIHLTSDYQSARKCTLYTKKFNIPNEGKHTIEYYSIDVIGNTEIIKSTTVIVDITSPDTTCGEQAPKYIKDDKLFITSLTKHSLIAADNLSGVNYSEFSIDSGPWQKYSEPFSISTDTLPAEYKTTGVWLGSANDAYYYLKIDPQGSIVVPYTYVGSWDTISSIRYNPYDKTMGLIVFWGDKVMKVDQQGNKIFETHIVRNEQGDLAIDPQDGSIWVVTGQWDRINGWLVKLDPSGRKIFEQKLGYYGRGVGIYKDSVWVSANGGRVIKFDKKGNKLHELYLGINTRISNLVINPDDGSVWTATVTGKIYKLNQEGNILLTKDIPLANGAIFWLSLDPKTKDIWLAIAYEQRAVKINQHGEILFDRSYESEGGRLYRLESDPEDGGAWLCLTESKKLIKISSQGNILTTFLTTLTNQRALNCAAVEYEIVGIALEDGLHNINYRSCDNVANWEGAKTKQVVLDNSPPEINITLPSGGETFIATQDKINIDYSVHDLGPFDATGYLVLVECPDKPELEGTKVLLDVDTGNEVASYAVSYSTSIEPLDLPYYGFYVLKVEATDWAGHFSSSETARFEVIWDIQPPQTTVDIGEPKWWGARPYVRSDTQFNLSSIDDLVVVGDRVGLGVKYLECWVNSSEHKRLDNTEPSQGQVVESSFTITQLEPNISEGKQSIYYFAEDILGNIEETKEQKVIIDNTAPTVNYHPTKFLYQNNTTVYASLSTKIGISATDVDQNFIHYNFTTAEQSDDFEVVSGSWTTDTHKGHYIQQDRYATGYTKSVIKNWRWAVRLDNPEYNLQVKVHISSYTRTGFNNTGNFAGGSLIYFRYQDKNNYYAMHLSKPYNQIRLIKVANNQESVIAGVDHPVELNRWYDINLSVDREHIAISIFGNEILSIDESYSFNTETIGLGTDNAVVRFAGLRITRPQDPLENSLASGFKNILINKDAPGYITYDYQPVEVAFNTDGLHTVLYKSQDNLTNESEETALNIAIDGTAPETELVTGVEFYQGLYAPESAVYSLSTKDPVVREVASGIFKTNYRVLLAGGGETDWVICQVNKTFKLDEGRRIVEYYSIDNVQNTETTKSKEIWVDGTAPVTTLTMTGGVQWTSSDGKLYADIDTQYVLTAEDPLSGEVASGVQDTYYKIDENPTWTLSTQPITLTEGIRTIYYWSNDNVLNAEQVKTFIVHVDNTAPVTSIEAGEPKCTEHGEPVSDAHQYTVITSNTQISILANDPIVKDVSSGVKDTYYAITQQSWTTYNQPFAITGPDGDYTVQYYSKDNVQNTEQTKSTIYTLDNTPPVAEIILPSEDNKGLCRIISGKTAIVGTVEDLHFKWYQLYWAEINTDTWDEICTKTYKEISEDVLAYWDTTGLSDGWYTIKLVAQDCVKNQTTDTVEVYVGRPELALEITGFNKPSYIVLDSTGNIYISDTNNDNVKKYDAQGELLMTLSGIKPQAQTLPGGGTGINKSDTFNKPTGLALDTTGNLYVADGNNDRVIKFSSDDSHLFTLSGFNKPHGLATDTQDNLYVADRNNDRIQKFSPNGTLLMTLNTGVEDDGLNKPQGVIAVDLQERIYVTDRNNDRVLIYNSSGVYITQISSASGLNKPDGIVVNQQGYIYVSDTNNDIVCKFDKYFNLVATYDGTTKTSQQKFNKPSGVTIDTEGNLYVVDSNNDKMLKYTLPEKPQQTDQPTAPAAASLRQHESPTDFKLRQAYAYPNPAKGGTNPILHIEVGIADRADIKVFNIAAELVHSAVLMGAPADKNGDGVLEYEYTWDVSNIASGVYIYCIIAEKQGHSPIKVIKKVGIIK